MGTASSPDAIASETFQIFRSIDTALSPIIGARGVVALYRRSLFLTKASYSWLAPLHPGSDATLDFAAVRAVLAEHDASHSLPAAIALLDAFTTLLVSLIGDSLTQQLLEGVWARPEPSPPAQDPSP